MVPVHKPRFVNKCWLRDADVVTLDIEDSVLPSEKEFARSQLREAIRIAAQGGADIFVRINSEKEMFFKDIAASMYPGLAGIHLPKAESPWDVMEAEKIISELEIERGFKPGSVALHLAVETARGFLLLEKIIAASRRVRLVNIGQEDFSRNISVELIDGDELVIPNFLMVITATAYGVIPVGLVASIANFRDKENFRKIVRNSVKAGLKGAGGIHPDQIPILNAGFSPSKDQVGLARRVIDIFEESKRMGDGAIALDGRMIDKPLVDRALKMLAWQKSIDDFQAYKDAMIAKNGGK
jgi:citrate lyase subunit beta/citryl-CoA lyase